MVTIGIPTYNRMDMVKVMAASLYCSDLSLPHHIHVSDDVSTEYGVEALQNLFPEPALITRNLRNVNSSRNIFLLCKHFLSTRDEYLFLADSDLIFSRDWLIKGIELIKQTDGVLSLFNSASLPVVETVNDRLCIKDVVGSAGTLFSRERVEEIVPQFDPIEKLVAFDWKFCKYLAAKGIKFYCTTTSYVQHIGWYGRNANVGFSYFDYGRNFKVESVEQGQVINDIFEAYMSNQAEKYRNEISKLKKNIFRRVLRKIYTLSIK